MTSAVIVVHITAKWGCLLCVCVCVCTLRLSSLWARQNPFWRRLVDLLNIIHLCSYSKTDCVCGGLGWSSLWTDLWLLRALVFLNEMFSQSVSQHGVRGSSPAMTMLDVKALGVCVRGGCWWGSCLLESV